jgi:hypothetical protein
MIPRRSSGSSRTDSGVEPTRSQNITVSWPRSAVETSATSLASGSGTGLLSLRSEAIAASNLRPMPDEDDAEILEVVGGQLGQHCGVDRVVAKRLFVLPHSEAVEPGSDVHTRLPAAITPTRLPYRNCKRCARNQRGEDERRTPESAPRPLRAAAPCQRGEASRYRFSMFHSRGIGDSGMPLSELRKALRATNCPIGR